MVTVEYPIDSWNAKERRLVFQVAKAQGFRVEVAKDLRKITIEGEDFPRFFGSLQETLAQQKKMVP